ncbi:hypothetical protein [Syntrophomonas wolfei]|uniref:hypothetical protein n=1 Tax=Syntrophomonas wolfei TaxID=863 RepID=UPI0023F45A27|nr:hypothetical protein [Syntrophomonas wolfei]
MKGYLKNAYFEYEGFKLHIYHQGKEYKEELITPNGDKQELPLFGVFNAFRQALLDKELQSYPEEMPVEEWALNYVDIVLQQFRDNLNVNQPEHNKPEEKLAYQVLFPGYSEQPIPYEHIDKNLPDYRAICFMTEFLSLTGAIIQWLQPVLNIDKFNSRINKGKASPPNAQYANKYLLPSQRYCDMKHDFGGIDSSWKIPKMIELALREADDYSTIISNSLILDSSGYRSKEIHSELIVIQFDTRTRVLKGTHFKSVHKQSVLAKLFSSRQGLLPLIWAEIMYAVEHDIYAGFCETCGSVFTYDGHRFNKKFCSPECSKEKVKNSIKEMDEEYRKKYQNLRKAKSRAQSQVEKDLWQRRINKLKETQKG